MWWIVLIIFLASSGIDKNSNWYGGEKFKKKKIPDQYYVQFIINIILIICICIAFGFFILGSI